jgi:hypothetical protein
MIYYISTYIFRVASILIRYPDLALAGLGEARRTSVVPPQVGYIPPPSALQQYLGRGAHSPGRLANNP